MYTPKVLNYVRRIGSYEKEEYVGKYESLEHYVPNDLLQVFVHVLQHQLLQL